MRSEPFTADMIDLLRLFEAHQVRYLLIGGYAVHFHGHVRFTADIDLAYDPEVENSTRLFEALREFWGGDIPHVASPDELAQPGMVFQFGVKPNRVDLLSRVAGIDLSEAWAPAGGAHRGPRHHHVDHRPRWAACEQGCGGAVEGPG